MPPKRLHEQCDNDTSEGALNLKKIQIVQGEYGYSENDSDEGIKKISIVTVLKRIFEYSNIFFQILIFVFNSWTFPESEYYSNIRTFWSEYSEII